MLEKNDCVVGLPVRLALGVEVDTTIGRVSRPGRFVAEAGAQNGRRMIYAAHPDPEPRPMHGVLASLPKSAGRGAPTLVSVSWEDGSRGECTLDQLEQAGEPPSPPPSIPLDRAAQLEHAIGCLELRVRALESAEASAGASGALEKTFGVPFDP